MKRLLVGSLALVVLAACERKSPEPPAPLPTLRPVVATAIADLERRVPPPADPGAVDEDLVRRMNGLMGFVRNAPSRGRALGIADLVASPPAATIWLAERALDEAAPQHERELALEVLSARGERADARALLDVLERARVAEVRAVAAWRLGAVSHDEILPRLVLRLRYETDWEAVLWIGHALARHGVWSGLDAMLTVAARAPDEGLRERARNEADAVAGEHGPTPSLRPEDIVRLWHQGDPALPVPPRSLAHQLELWRWLARLDEFQLRGVDDCRFLMPRLDRFAAGVLAEALYDESPYVRLGAAQCLEAMGPRGRDAGFALLEHLADPELGVWMAAALGRVGHPGAREALERRLARAYPEPMRIAAARALGRIGLAESVPALRAAFAATPADEGELRQALAEALVWCGSPDGAIDVLVEALVDPRLEPSTSEAALRHHLAREATAGVEGAAERLAAWDALGTDERAAAPGAQPVVFDRKAARARADLFKAPR